MLTALEEKILKYISDYLRENDGQAPTLAEIGFACNIKSVGTIHRYVSSIQSKGYLDRSQKGWRTLSAPMELPFRGIIAAGQPIEAIEQGETFNLASLIQPDCFILKVKGESMIDKGIYDGDFVIVRSSSTATNGDIVVALVDGEDASLKEFRKRNNGKKIELIPYNKNMQPMILDSGRVEVQGIMTSIIRTFID